MKFLVIASIFSLTVLASNETASYLAPYENLKKYYEFLYTSEEAYNRFEDHESHKGSIGFAQAEVADRATLLFEQAREKLNQEELSLLEYEQHLYKLSKYMLRIIHYWAPSDQAS